MGTEVQPMETEIQRLLDALVDLREQANVNAVFGEPVTAEGRTIIPVASATYGFKMGIWHEAVEEGTQEAAEGTGGDGGGGVTARPLGVVVVAPEGICLQPIIDRQKVALAGGLLTGWAIFWLGRALLKIFGRQA